MRIREILSEYRNDFVAVLACEHCGKTQPLTGYHDNHYHTQVISKMTCFACGKDREGNTVQSQATKSALEIENQQLRTWIRETGKQMNICTFNILDEICRDCNCARQNPASTPTHENQGNHL